MLQTIPSTMAMITAGIIALSPLSPLTNLPKQGEYILRVKQLTVKEIEDNIETFTRGQLIDILVQVDANGMWTDEDSIAEGHEPLTIDEVKEYIVNMFSEQTVLEKQVRKHGYFVYDEGGR